MTLEPPPMEYFVALLSESEAKVDKRGWNIAGTFLGAILLNPSGMAVKVVIALQGDAQKSLEQFAKHVESSPAVANTLLNRLGNEVLGLCVGSEGWEAIGDEQALQVAALRDRGMRIEDVPDAHRVRLLHGMDVFGRQVVIHRRMGEEQEIIYSEVPGVTLYSGAAPHYVQRILLSLVQQMEGAEFFTEKLSKLNFPMSEFGAEYSEAEQEGHS